MTDLREANKRLKPLEMHIERGTVYPYLLFDDARGGFYTEESIQDALDTADYLNTPYETAPDEMTEPNIGL